MQDPFQLNLLAALSHSVVFFVKESYGNTVAYNGGGPDYNSTPESTAQMMQAMRENYAPLSELFRSQIMPNELAKLEASKAITPEYASFVADTLSKYGGGVNEATLKLDEQSRLGSAATDKKILDTYGKDMSLASQDIDKLINPDYYNVREKTGKSITDLLGSLDPNNTGVEADRSLAKMDVMTGGAGSPKSASKTLAGGMAYGNERLKRLSALSEAIKTASNFLPASKSEFNPVQISLQRPSNNYASNKINTQQNPGDEAFSTGNNMFNQLTQLQQGFNQGMASKRSGLQDAAMMMSATGDLLGGVSSI